MSNRPTPEQIINQAVGKGSDLWGPWVIDRLAAHSFRIVHPDDVTDNMELAWYHATGKKTMNASEYDGFMFAMDLIFGGDR